MSVSNLTNGCKKATKKHTLKITSDQVVQLQLGLKDRIEKLEELIDPQSEDELYSGIREQCDIARETLEVIHLMICRGE